ncbi:hypothetical protein ASPFODRAFT_53042 [Aspergillus luchuensis CBS 106.47]|uniref:Uncharacterized protein n=1 Tax=Aspergillus luchuensis (strain CBS 106.47) TaxID=1137211 RepID=A0A1M3T207_ASPLC|nr:hypothetical protein ASPFODRAFT_53042 [Aspergillus luchuensis CBS 106.47]
MDSTGWGQNSGTQSWPPTKAIDAIETVHFTLLPNDLFDLTQVTLSTTQSHFSMNVAVLSFFWGGGDMPPFRAFFLK